jgi:hypothetical protein
LAVWGPRGSGQRGVVNYDELARRVEGVLGVVKGSRVEAMPSREGGGRVPRAEKIEGQLSLGEEGVPEVEGKVKVCGREEGNEVVLECADRTFRRVRAVIVRGDVLYCDRMGLRAEEGREVSGSLIIGDEVGNGKSKGAEEEEGLRERLNVGYRGTGILWFYVNIA